MIWLHIAVCAVVSEVASAALAIPEVCTRQTGCDDPQPLGFDDETSFMQSKMQLRNRNKETPTKIGVDSGSLATAALPTDKDIADASGATGLPSNAEKVVEAAQPSPKVGEGVVNASPTNTNATIILDDEVADESRVSLMEDLATEQASKGAGAILNQELDAEKRLSAAATELAADSNASGGQHLAALQEASAHEGQAKMVFITAYTQVLLAFIIVPMAIAGVLTMLLREGRPKHEEEALCRKAAIDEALYNPTNARDWHRLQALYDDLHLVPHPLHGNGQ